MLLHVPNVLSKEEVTAFRAVLDKALWVDGRVTAGVQSGSVKVNEQLDENSNEAKDLGNRVLDALAKSPLFFSGALPLKIFPPLFNRYGGGQYFGTHVDNAIRNIQKTAIRIRTDLSCTLFLADPEEYDGGELCIEDTFGVHEVKLPAGDLLLYPSTSLHSVTAITKGIRVASFFWLQSMVREEENRRLLFQLDQNIQALTLLRGVEDKQVVSLTGIYHNLIRKWADA